MSVIRKFRYFSQTQDIRLVCGDILLRRKLRFWCHDETNGSRGDVKIEEE